MPMTLYFKRAKCFVQNDDNGSRKFLAQPGPHPQPVPFWVASTPTFKQGIKDQSIVNLTPPEQMPGYKPVVAAAAAAAVEEDTEESRAEIPEEADQTAVPQAPFGGQPMTPVAPAPKVGRVSAGAGRGGK